MCVCVLTVEGVQVDGESAGLAVSFATFSTHIRPVTGVCSHVPRQLYGLGEDGLTVLTHIHLPCTQKHRVSDGQATTAHDLETALLVGDTTVVGFFSL